MTTACRHIYLFFKRKYLLTWTFQLTMHLKLNFNDGTICIDFCVCAKLLELCPNLCNPIVCRPPGSLVHGFLQSRILKWVSIPSSRGSSQPNVWTHISCSPYIAGIFFTPELHQVPPSMGFSRQEYCLSYQGSPYMHRLLNYINSWKILKL